MIVLSCLFTLEDGDIDDVQVACHEEATAASVEFVEQAACHRAAATGGAEDQEPEGCQEEAAIEGAVDQERQACHEEAATEGPDHEQAACHEEAASKGAEVENRNAISTEVLNAEGVVADTTELFESSEVETASFWYSNTGGGKQSLCTMAISYSATASCCHEI